MEPGRTDQLVVALRSAARTMSDRRTVRDLEETLARIVSCAMETIPAVDAAGISMTEQGRIESRYPTSEAIRELDETQGRLSEGPGIIALEDPPESGIVVAQDLDGDDAPRWPRFAPEAVAAGYRGLMSTTLTSEGGVRGSLNLYSRHPDAFDERSRTLAGIFGVQAALVLVGVHQATSLQRAVDSRDLIGRAKGILMERFGVDDQTAFQMLVRSSQDTNLKLTTVARWLPTEAARRARPDAGRGD